MGATAAGSVFWAVSLVLFPVAAQLSSLPCVTYKHLETCGLQGSSVEFPCSYPKAFQVISKSGWSKRLHPDMNPEPLTEMPAYSVRMKYLERETNDCTMKLADVKRRDTDVYYFIYTFRNVTGYRVTCKGVPGVRLHIYASPVRILVKKLVRGQPGPAADWTVMEGQRIMLTCVSTCAANLNSNPGYIWYKNRLQLNGSRANLPVLSLDPISNEDTGSYVCVMIGYEDLPSTTVNLRVLKSVRNTMVPDEVPGGGSKKDIVPTLTQQHGCDAQNSTGHIFDNCPTPIGKGMFTFAIILIASVCVGLAIAIMVSILVLKVKKKKKSKMKRRRCAASVPGPPDRNSGTYMALDVNSMSPDYDTLDAVRRCSAADTIYENLHQPRKSVA